MTGSEALEILQWLTSAVLWLCCASLRRRLEAAEKKAEQTWKWAHNSHTRLLPVETGLKQLTAAVNVLSDAVAPIDRTTP